MVSWYRQPAIQLDHRFNLEMSVYLSRIIPISVTTRNLTIIPKKMPSTKRALVFLGTGSEEMEAVTAIDVLRRAGVDVYIAGIPDGQPILCSRNIKLVPDLSIDEAPSKVPYDVIVMPGGLGGTEQMIKSKIVGDLLKQQEQAKRLIAAICAAPTALKAHGICVGCNVTSYPAMEPQMVENGQYKYHQDDVVIDGNLITSRGPGTATKFALTIVEQLFDKIKAKEVAKAMLVEW